MSNPFYVQLPDNSLPAHPRNLSIAWSFSKVNAIDLKWDNPSDNPLNEPFNIQGVNLYRTYNNEVGEYHKVNDSLITVGYYEDAMTHTEVTEDVSNKFMYAGNGPRGEWVFEVDHPIVQDLDDRVFANNPDDVVVTIDGQVQRALKVDGQRKCVYLPNTLYIDKLTRKSIQPILPKPTSEVLCTYRYNSNYIQSHNNQRIFYKVTTVDDKGLESDLKYSPAMSFTQNERWDYVWKEAVRRNRWILDQAGTDCWVLVRKWFGTPCHCLDVNRQTGLDDCPACFGVGVLGGYEGPYKFKTAPHDTQTTTFKDDRGYVTQKTGDLWTNYAPLLKTQDLLYYPSGEVYVVGYVQQSEVRGNPMLQQNFNVSLLPRDRIEYKIPFYFNNPYRETDPQIITDEQLVTEKANIHDGEEVRGNTVVFENWHY